MAEARAYLEQCARLNGCIVRVYIIDERAAVGHHLAGDANCEEVILERPRGTPPRPLILLGGVETGGTLRQRCTQTCNVQILWRGQALREAVFKVLRIPRCQHCNCNHGGL